jgi:hypothetical protein
MYFGTYNVAVTGDLRHNVRLIGGFGVHVWLRAVLSSARGFLSHNLELPSLSKQVGSSRITLCSLQDKLRDTRLCVTPINLIEFLTQCEQTNLTLDLRVHGRCQLPVGACY